MHGRWWLSVVGQVALLFIFAVLGSTLALSYVNAWLMAKALDWFFDWEERWHHRHCDRDHPEEAEEISSQAAASSQ